MSTTNSAPQKLSIKEHINNMKFNIRNNSFVSYLYSRRWFIHETLQNDINGYSENDVANLGDRLIYHLAELLDYLSRQPYDNTDLEWINQLRKTSDFFYSYNDTFPELEVLGRINSLNRNETENNRSSEPLVKKTYDTINSCFLEHWEWVGENILTENFVTPQNNSDRNRINTQKETDQLLVVKNFLEIKKSITAAMQRHKTKKSFCDDDIVHMPIYELSRLSNLLLTFAYKTNGYPVNYRNSDNTDYDAWTQDILYTEDVISTWRDWIKQNGIKHSMSKIGATKHQIEIFDMKLHEEFMSSWMWLGRNIHDLWY